MKSKLKTNAVVSMSFAFVAGSAIAAAASQFAHIPSHVFGARPAATNTLVLGGGSTLPVPAYLGKTFNGSFQPSGYTSTGVPGSIFGFFASQIGGLNIEYCSTGSGEGKRVFAGPTNTVDTLCSNADNNPQATTFGFLPPSGSPTQHSPTLASTDAPLTQPDYDSYTLNHGSPIEPVELPALFGSIAMYYREDGHSTRITLSDSQICAIYTNTSGYPMRFGNLVGNGDSTIVRPVYQMDDSGTTFSFLNHLNEACGVPVNQSFLSAVRVPTNAIGATGDNGAKSAVLTHNGAIGYVETGYLLPLIPGTNFANVINSTNNVVYDPVAGLPASANTVTADFLQSDVAVNQTTYAGGGGPATTSGLTGVRSRSCIKVLPPRAYAQPKTGYPIIAVSYTLANNIGNGSYGAAALRLLEKDLTTPALFKHPGHSGPISTVDIAEGPPFPGTTGYSGLGSSFAEAIQLAANSCINS